MFQARVVVAVCATVVILGLVASCGARPAAPEPVRSATSPGVMTGLPATAPQCGGVRPVRPAGGDRYTCTFTDDFDGTKLDATKWTAVRSADHGFTTGHSVGSPDCYLARPANVSVSDGRLRLTSRVEGIPFVCHTQYGDHTTRDSAGSVTSRGKFAQTYGRFEFRAKFPSNVTTDFDSALWMYPPNPAYGGGRIPGRSMSRNGSATASAPTPSSPRSTTRARILPRAPAVTVSCPTPARISIPTRSTGPPP